MSYTDDEEVKKCDCDTNNMCKICSGADGGDKKFWSIIIAEIGCNSNVSLLKHIRAMRALISLEAEAEIEATKSTISLEAEIEATKSTPKSKPKSTPKPKPSEVRPPKGPSNDCLRDIIKAHFKTKGKKLANLGKVNKDRLLEIIATHNIVIP